MKSYILLFLSLLCEIAADYLFKAWSLSEKTLQVISGGMLYMLSALAFAFWIKEKGSLARGISLFTITNCLAGCVIGVFIFHEPFTTQMKIGVLLGITAIFLLA